MFIYFNNPLKDFGRWFDLLFWPCWTALTLTKTPRPRFLGSGCDTLTQVIVELEPSTTHRSLVSGHHCISGIPRSTLSYHARAPLSSVQRQLTPCSGISSWLCGWPTWPELGYHSTTSEEPRSSSGTADTRRGRHARTHSLEKRMITCQVRTNFSSRQLDGGPQCRRGSSEACPSLFPDCPHFQVSTWSRGLVASADFPLHRLDWTEGNHRDRLMVNIMMVRNSNFNTESVETLHRQLMGQPMFLTTFKPKSTSSGRDF